MAKGPLRGCDVALIPRGRAAGGPREAQEVHRARTRVHAGPHGRPCGAPRGKGSVDGGPTANALPRPTF